MKKMNQFQDQATGSVLGKVAEKIRQEYSKLSSMSLYVNDDEEEQYITISCVRYRDGNNGITTNQMKFLRSLENVTFKSSSNLMKFNKWVASAYYSCKGVS